MTVTFWLRVGGGGVARVLTAYRESVTVPADRDSEAAESRWTIAVPAAGNKTALLSRSRCAGSTGRAMTRPMRCEVSFHWTSGTFNRNVGQRQLEPNAIPQRASKRLAEASHSSSRLPALSSKTSLSQDDWSRVTRRLVSGLRCSPIPLSEQLNRVDFSPDNRDLGWIPD